MPSTFQKKISDINDTIAAGDFHDAAYKLTLLASNEPRAAGPAKTINYLRLKVFNRLQWLVEAADAVAELSGSQGLIAEEYLEVALFYVLTGDVEEAEYFMRQAMTLDKRSFLLASELAILFEQQGKREKALSIYNKILKNMLARKKVDTVGARVLNRLAGLRSLTEVEIDQVAALCSKYTGGDLEVRLLFALAKCYAKVGNINNEIDCLEKANRLADRVNESQVGAQTIAASRHRLEAIKALFDQPTPAWLPTYFQSGRAPVFILGMPRSGTTLVEQILGAHSAIGNSGESRAMGIAFQRRLLDKPLLPEDAGSTLPFLRYKALDYEDSKAIISDYDQYQALLSDKPVITDKELSNIDRVGIILKLYPNAKFIYVQRHPLDVCASIMQQDFSQAYFSGSSLKIVQEYEVYYEKAVHWQKLYPNAVSIIEYESLVSDFETNIRTLLDFLGLAWEEAIKTFYTRDNSVRTPSVTQVRSSINSKSVGKWHKYKQLTQPAEQYLMSRGSMLTTYAKSLIVKG